MVQAVDVNGLSRKDAAALLGWWLEAGVDVPVAEEARDWRKVAVRRSVEGPDRAGDVLASQAHPQPLPQAGGEQITPLPLSGGEQKRPRPDSFEAFHEWLAQSSDLPLFRAGAARALPHGPRDAEVMLLTGIPAPEDVAEGKPIGGAAWRLATRMLAAIGIAPDAAYVAASTCFSGTGTRFTPGETEACRDTMLAQIALAAPRRLLLLGDAPARLLIGQPLAQARGRLHRIGGIPAVVTFHPRQLIERPADKALAWRDLLTLMGDDI